MEIFSASPVPIKSFMGGNGTDDGGYEYDITISEIQQHAGKPHMRLQ
jgi:hypothetical protein